jgi:hypothetical protein
MTITLYRNSLVLVNVYAWHDPLVHVIATITLKKTLSTRDEITSHKCKLLKQTHGKRAVMCLDSILSNVPFALPLHLPTHSCRALNCEAES